MSFFTKTPLIKFKEIGKGLKVDVYGKIETVNPTGSHKDRESLQVISEVRKCGYRGVGCASTGNAAISLAAYSYMNGVPCHIYVSERISRERLALIKTFLPVIKRVKGGYAEAIELSNEEMEKSGIYNANPGKCQAKIVGNSFIGKEIAGEIKPDFVICPTNNGTHLIGVWEGLKETGLKPRMVAAVAEETKIADSIHGFHKLEEPKLSAALRESNGPIIKVTDHEIGEATALLLKEGIIAEPASAASVAAINHINFEKKDVICCTITGSGMKFPKTMRKALS